MKLKVMTLTNLSFSWLISWYFLQMHRAAKSKACLFLWQAGFFPHHVSSDRQNCVTVHGTPLYFMDRTLVNYKLGYAYS